MPLEGAKEWRRIGGIDDQERIGQSVIRAADALSEVEIAFKGIECGTLLQALTAQRFSDFDQDDQIGARQVEFIKLQIIKPSKEFDLSGAAQISPLISQIGKDVAIKQYEIAAQMKGQPL